MSLRTMGARWLGRFGLTRPELRAWAMYDWANSAFWTTIIAAVFPYFFVRTAAAGMAAPLATSRLALCTALSIAIVALVSPLLGSFADFTATRKRLLAVFLVISLAATCGLWLVESGDWRFALVLFLVGNIGAAVSMTFYDSLLPHIASPDELDRVSSSAYALGYLGGGLLLVLNLLWIGQPSWFGFADGVSAAHASFVSVAIWWAVFSVPLFRRVPEPPADRSDATAGLSPWLESFVRLGHTFRELRSYKQALMLLVAFAIYNDGINTIIRMASAYGAEIGVPASSLMLVFVLVQFAGVPFSFLFGSVAARIGAKRAVLYSLGVYGLIAVFGYFVSVAWHFYVLGFAVAIVQGGSQALSRSMFATMVPRHKSSEFFAFFGIFDKFAGVLGPLLFGIVAAQMGSSRPAILSLVVFFAAGAYLLTRVDIEAGQRAARAAEATRADSL